MEKAGTGKEGTPFRNVALDRQIDERQPEHSSGGGLKRPSLNRRPISTQSEDDMLESLFNLRQSATYDVTTNHGAWQRLRTLCKRIIETKQFTFLIMSAILLNMICMGLEHYGQPKRLTVVLENINIIFVTMFGIEMIIKLLGYGVTAYLSQGQNVFDGIIVIVSVCEILLIKGNSSLSIFRSIRLLRIFKLVKPVRYQILVVVKTMTSVMTFFVLLLLFMFAFAILGMNLFGGKFKFENEEGKQVTSRSNFDNFLWAMMSVFQILTQENWNQVMYDGMRATNKWAALYFIALMAVGYYVLFNLLVAVLVEGFTDSGQPEASPRNKQESAGKNAPDRKRTFMKITETRSDWSLFLFSPSNRLRRLLLAVCEHKYFDYAVLFCILISCVVLVLEEPNIDHQKRQIIDIAMFILTIMFSLEMLMKIVAHGFVLGPGTYLKDSWNVLDGILVLFSWIDVIIAYSPATAPEVLGAFKVFRALRTLRPLRMIRRAPGLKLVVQTLLYSLKPTGKKLFWLPPFSL
ncbi:Voltage-dependent T-type calcium channel subunit alpha-1G [Desmophyllum pertusum]|uniref:Voltage-dependent T-type calcium channel subunit alpha-1G n=1 Tax=Desmophyllum pertusum TaxID=174260 RepID=A0A9W9YJT1_9CNID|nr:Voltage-dependent T-type calcium channel subunit alpha-1G [Desmophyllum pertusum]